MMQFVREFRLIPVVLLAIVCLLALKVLGLVLDGGYTLADFNFGKSDEQVASQPDTVSSATATAPATTEATVAAARAKMSWAQEMFNFPEVTGSIAAEKQAEKNAEKLARESKGEAAPPVNPPDPKPNGRDTVIQFDANRPSSPAERAILERLGERRQELDARERELEIRENLLKSAEKRVESRVNELKEIETRINGAIQKKDEAEALRFKGLVSMYENMKAKDAAKIFDRLDLRILAEVASQINPRRMSDIMAQMSAEAAERLTVEFANRARIAERAPSANDLPKIEGRPRP